MTRRSFLLAISLFATTTLLGCTRSSRPRCAECGMFADVAPSWSADARTTSGETLHFDTPKCLFAHALRHGASALAAKRVTEHYAQRLVPAESVVYVIGSDLVGPMGRDVVPVAREHAATFAQEHGGQAIEARAIDATVLARLSP